MKLDQLRAQFQNAPATPVAPAPRAPLPAAGGDSNVQVSANSRWGNVRSGLVRSAKRAGGWPNGTKARRLPERADFDPVVASDDIALEWRPPGRGSVPIVVAVEVERLSDMTSEFNEYKVPSFPGEAEAR